MRFLLYILLIIVGCNRAEPAFRPAQKSGSPGQSAQKPGQSAEKNKGASRNVLDVLSFVRDNGAAPEGFVGGRDFQNREKRLPKTGPNGRKINYREWDVHKKTPGKNRGPDRLVTGDDGSAWYTEDHYKTFRKLEQ